MSPGVGTCDNCGRAGEKLVEVHRAYFFDADDPEPRVEERAERWCGACAASYPHVRAG